MVVVLDLLEYLTCLVKRRERSELPAAVNTVVIDSHSLLLSVCLLGPTFQSSQQYYNKNLFINSNTITQNQSKFSQLIKPSIKSSEMCLLLALRVVVYVALSKD